MLRRGVAGQMPDKNGGLILDKRHNSARNGGVVDTKKRYSKAERDEIRNHIASLKQRISSAVFDKRAPPASIVTGTLSQIREFKERCEQAAVNNFVKNDPGDTLSGRELLEVKARLETIASQIHA